MSCYEVVCNILNECERNQMRDVSIFEVETEDPEAYVRDQFRHAKDLQLNLSHSENGEIDIDVVVDGLHEKFSFSKL